MNASKWFSEEECAAVNDAVVEAETLTAAEIVPVIAGQSDDYPRSCDLVGVWVGLVVMLLIWLIIPEEHGEIGSWGGWSSGSKLLMLCMGMLGGFTLGMLLAHLIAPLRRGFTPRKDMDRAVERKAKEVFFDQRVNHTGGGQGILFFVSIFEETAVVLADQLIIETLGDEAIEALAEAFTERLRDTSPITALIETIEETGELLAEPLPREDEDEDELSNELVIL